MRVAKIGFKVGPDLHFVWRLRSSSTEYILANFGHLICLELKEKAKQIFYFLSFQNSFFISSVSTDVFRFFKRY